MARKGSTADYVGADKPPRKLSDKQLSILAAGRERAKQTLSQRRRGDDHRYGVTCGRRHCRKCSGWLFVTDFGVNIWADAEKTRPKILQSACYACQRRTKRFQRIYKKQEKQKNQELRERASGVVAILKRMSREQRFEYELEGVLPILPRGVVMEDLDPTPVPTGCPECWRRCPGSAACDECPDPQTKEKRRIYLREVKQQGLALLA